MRNPDLKWFESEEPQKLYDKIDQYLYEKSTDAIVEMLSDLRDDNETSAQHVERRHMQMDIDKMVMTALKTGQKQGIFMNEDKELLQKEDVYDNLMTALYEKLDDIVDDMISSIGSYSNQYTADTGGPIGYCINDNFELVQTSSITFAIKENTDPILMRGNIQNGTKEFLAPPFCCSTMYPDAKPEEGLVVVIKTRDELMKEYNLTEHDLKKFDRMNKNRNDLRNIHQKDRDAMQKEFEKNAIFKMMQSR